MMPAARLIRTILAGAVATVTLSSCATVAPSGPRSDLLALGKNANGDPCTASANWSDPSQPDFLKYKDVYSVTCRGAPVEALARVRLFETDAARSAHSATLTCAEAQPVTLAGFDRAVARRCYDPALGYAAVVIDADRGTARLQISAAPNAVGAGYQAALLLSGGGDVEVTSARSPIDLAMLADAPEAPEQVASAAGTEAGDTILARATALNFRGLSSDASRYLRNELGRLPDDTPAKIRAELLLEAGLADSNIRFFRSATANFDTAATLVGRLSAADQRQLRPKLQVYRGLHALNQRDFEKTRELLRPLAESAGGAPDLSDPNALVRINSAGSDRSDLRSALALPNLEWARESVVGALGNWALSVAELSLGNRPAARQAIGLAQAEFDALDRSFEGQRVERSGLYWLDARLTRQRGRIDAADGDYDAAVAAFDEAIERLVTGARSRSFALSDPAVAELRLERASLVARSGKAPGVVEAAYNEAIDAMLAAREDGAGFSTGLLHPFLDDLAGRMAKNDKAAAARYFEALQISGESSAARQLSQLQEIVAEDGGVAGKRRDRQDLELRLSDIDAEIADLKKLGQPFDALERERAEVQARFFEIDAELGANARLSQVTDRPASLAEVQAKLKPGEAYVRLTVMNDRVFGMLVEKDKAHAIRPQLGSGDILGLSSALRRSSNFNEQTGRVPEFSVGISVALYQALFAGLDPVLRSKEELVFDGGEVMSGLPAGILVTDRNAAVTFARQEDKFDYSKIEFLASIVPTSVAMSPRSFIASREFGPSRATKPLLGLASPESIGARPIGQGGKFRIGPCLLDAGTFARINNQFSPIPSDEIYLAARALGLAGDPPLISGAQFSDTALARLGAAGGQLSEYQVLHFATHGVTEGQFDCAEAPAALITSYGGSSASDLLLSYDEIASLRLDANLVVLAACDTASQTGEAAQIRAGEARPGSTLDGLVRAFFAAGSRAVMATYWEASNTGPTAFLMEEFYRSGRTNTIAASLNQAQRSLISNRDTSHPYYWASFFVVGETGNRLLTGGGAKVARR